MSSPRAVFALVLLIAPVANGQEKDLPRGEEIMDRFVEVTGGKAAYQKFTTRVATGTWESREENRRGKITITRKAPNLLLQVLEVDNAGKFIQGTDGSLAWEVNPINGDHILEGNEKADFMRGARFQGEVDWREDFATAECTGLEDIEGKPAYKVVLTPKEGLPETAYFDKESGLIVRQVMTVSSAMGEFQDTITSSDYKDVDGIKIPHTSVQQFLSRTIKFTYDSIEHDQDIPTSTFDVPEQIKKLMK